MSHSTEIGREVQCGHGHTRFIRMMEGGRGKFRGEEVDNTTEEEVGRWIEKLVAISPESVMIYPIARETPVHNLEKIPFNELERIAARVRKRGLKVEVFG